MTVKELKAELEKFDDDCEVIVKAIDDHTRNVLVLDYVRVFKSDRKPKTVEIEAL